RTIVAKYLVDIGYETVTPENLDFDDVTMFLSDSITKGTKTVDEAIQYIIDMVLQPGEIDKSELEEAKDSVKPEDIEQDEPIEVGFGVKPKFDAKAGNSDELQSQFTAGIGSLEAEVPIDIALSENIIQDNLDGI